MRPTLRFFALSATAGVFPARVSYLPPQTVLHPKKPATFSHPLPSLLSTVVYSV